MRLLLPALLLLGACSSGHSSSASSPAPGPTPAGSVSYATVQPLFQNDCGGCHNGSNQNINLATGGEAVVDANKAQIYQMVSNGTMPQNQTLSPNDKALILQYTSQ